MVAPFRLHYRYMGGRGLSYSRYNFSRRWQTPTARQAPSPYVIQNLAKFGGIQKARVAVMQVYRGTASPEIHKLVNRLSPDLRYALLKNLPHVAGLTKAEPTGGIYGDVHSFEQPTTTTVHGRIKRVLLTPYGTKVMARSFVHEPIQGAEPIITRTTKKNKPLERLTRELHRKAKAAEPRARREMSKLKHQLPHRVPPAPQQQLTRRRFVNPKTGALEYYVWNGKQWVRHG